MIIANIVTTSKALVTTSDALVTTSFFRISLFKLYSLEIQHLLRMNCSTASLTLSHPDTHTSSEVGGQTESEIGERWKMMDLFFESNQDHLTLLVVFKLNCASR